MECEPFYNPGLSYEENYRGGPFGVFASGERFEREGEPEHDFLGFKVYQPFGIPAGPLINGNFVKAALMKGFDICTYKTVRTLEYPCHQWPNVLSVNIEGDLTSEKAAGELVADNEYTREGLAITNSFGVPSAPVDQWQEDLAQVVKFAHSGQVVVGSFQGTTRDKGGFKAFIDDHVLAARLVKETKVPILKINLSCPNEGTSDLLCFDIERTREIVHAVKNEIGDTPLILKLAYFDDKDLLSDFVTIIGPFVQGLAAINTISATVVDKKGNQALPGKGRERSGVCGSPIKWAGLDMTRCLKRLREELNLNYAIVGVGGITTSENFHEYRQAGADVALSATGAMWNAYLAQEIWEAGS